MGYIAPSRRTLCTACGATVQRTRTSSKTAIVCSRCRASRHGRARYGRGCRCDTCRTAKVEYERAARARRSPNGSCSKCSRPAHARGLCSTHYAYWYRRWISGEASRGGSWIEPFRRLRLYERDGWRCTLCGVLVDRDADPNSSWALSLDHVIPRRNGGDHADSNLRCAHRRCNTRRGVSSPTER